MCVLKAHVERFYNTHIDLVLESHRSCLRNSDCSDERILSRRSLIPKETMNMWMCIFSGNLRPSPERKPDWRHRRGFSWMQNRLGWGVDVVLDSTTRQDGTHRGHISTLGFEMTLIFQTHTASLFGKVHSDITMYQEICVYSSFTEDKSSKIGCDK